jgi:hypothetical protein
MCGSVRELERIVPNCDGGVVSMAEPVRGDMLRVVHN